jgi:hypothetical protein
MEILTAILFYATDLLIYLDNSRAAFTRESLRSSSGWFTATALGSSPICPLVASFNA